MPEKYLVKQYRLEPSTRHKVNTSQISIMPLNIMPLNIGTTSKTARHKLWVENSYRGAVVLG
jgi:hypothetical protein